MLKGLNTTRYQPRVYIISEGDSLSADKVTKLESGYGNHIVRSISIMKSQTSYASKASCYPNYPAGQESPTASQNSSIHGCYFFGRMRQRSHRETTSDTPTFCGPTPAQWSWNLCSFGDRRVSQ